MRNQFENKQVSMCCAVMSVCVYKFKIEKVMVE